MKKFIYVQDKKIKDKLLSLGYHLIQENNNLYIFENKETLNFDLDDTYKYVMSDILTF